MFSPNETIVSNDRSDEDMDSFLRDRLSMLTAIGCGVAFGVSGIYTYYVTNRQINSQINSLTNTIEDLKKEVKELRIASTAVSMAASQAHSPIHSQVFHFDASDHPLYARLDSSEATLETDRCQLDGRLIAPPVDNSVSTDDNEEFFDFTEGETESELVGSGNYQDNGDSSSQTNLKTGSSLDEWLQRYDRLLDDMSVNKKDLYEQIIAIQPKFNKSGDIFWRSAKAAHLYGIAAQKEGNSQLKKKLSFEALDLATKAVELDETNPECHKWYAITVGSLSDYITTKEKILNGHKFKEHVDIALRLKSHDPSLHHMLGRFCYEIANLTWVEKKVASALFSKVPESSFDDSLSHLLKAYDLRAEWKENILFISKVLFHQKKFSEAIKWVDKGLALKNVGEDDVLADQLLVSLNTKLAKYR